MPSLAQLRGIVPGSENMTDAELIQDVAETAGLDPTVVAQKFGFGQEKGGLTKQQFSSSLDQYQAGLYGVGEAAASGLGAEGVSSWMANQRKDNELRANIASSRARSLGAVDSWEDVHGVGDFGSYAKSLAIQSVPYAAEALTGGLATRGAMSGTRAALTAAKEAKDVAGVARAERALNMGSQAGAVAASYPSAVGDVLGNQREQAGETRGGVAAALAVPYAALNAFGVEGALARGTAFKNTVNILDRGTGLTGAAARTAATATGVALKEGASETGQEMVNQVGRMSVDSNEAFLSEAAQERFKESFIGGATLGGLAGGAAGGWRRSSAGGNDISQAMGDKDTTQPDITTQQFQAPAPAMREQITEDGEIIQVPVVQTQQAPAVAGGQTEIAQAQQQAQAAQQQQQAQAQQAQAAEQAAQQFGVVNPATPAVGSAFGQKVYGKNIPAVANAIATFTAQMPPQQVQLAQAITQANALTGGKLISFQFNANNVMASVEQGLKAVGKVATKLQIDQAETVEEAAAILDDQSTQLKGDKLEQVNAIHVAITGQNTTGYEAAQQPKGAKDDRLQLQDNAGIREVPVSGGTTEAITGGDGGVRPTEVQPVGATSVGAGPSGVQAGQPSAEGVRASAGDVSSAVSTVTPQAQVSGATNVQAAQGNDGGREPGQPKQADNAQVDSQGVRAGPRRYAEPPSYYATDLAHIKGERRIEIIKQLFAAALAPKTVRKNTVPAETRAEFLRLALMEQLPHKTIAELTGVKLDTVEKQLERMGVVLVDGQFEMTDPTVAQSFVSAAVDFRSPEFPDGLGEAEVLALYTTRYEADEVEGQTLAEEIQAGEQEGKPQAKLAEELYSKDSADTKTMGTISSAGGSQGAVEATDDAFFAKVGRLQALLDTTPETDEAGRANLAKQIEAQWAQYAKKQATRAETGEVEVAPTEDEDAVQEPSAEEVPVRKRAKGGKAVGKGNTEGDKAAAEGETKVKPKQEEVKTPKEQYEALAETTNLLPPYESLDARERAQVDDQAHQGELTLASLNTMFSGNAKFGKDVRAKKPYTAAELTKEIEDFTRTAVSGRKLVIVDSVEDLLKSKDSGVQKIGAVLAIEGAFGVAVNGKAYLIANRIEKGMGRAKFMHEVGAHLGLENLLPKATYDRLVGQIKKWADSDADTDEVTLAARAEMRVLNANTPAEDADAEMLAYFIEEAVQAGIDPTASMQETGPLAQWFRTLWAAFKAAVRKLGFNPEALTAQDVVDMAFGAAQLEMATATDTESKAPKFGFAGVKAAGAATEERQAGLMSAQMDLANGKDPKEIWDETGWYKGTDGQWRFEFDDTNAQFKGVLEGKKFSDIARMEESTLGEILEHEELFRNYPELRDVKFEVRSIPMDFQRATQGWFDAKLNKLFVTPYAIDPLSTVLHEVQHWIQSKEGFENGANPSGSDLSNKVALRKLRAELIAHIDRAAELEADRTAAIREGRYRSTFDEALRGFKARDLLPAVDTLLAQSPELAPKYVKLRELDAEIERVENAKKILAQKQKEQNKKAGLMRKVIDYAGQMQDLRVYANKAQAATKEREAVNAEITAVVNNIAGGKAVAHEIYRLVAGEAEARNTQRRQKMTAAERKASFPESTMDVRPENTIRAIGRDGTYLSTERMRFGKEAAQPAGVFSKAGEWLDAAITSPKETLHKLKLGFLTLDQLAELDKSPGQVVRAYSDVSVAMQMMSKDMVDKAVKIDHLWAKLDPKEAKRLSETMRAATRAQYDPALGTAATNQTQQEVKDLYAGLTNSGRDVYAKVKKYYEDAFATRLAIMEEAAAKLGGKELKEIQDLYSKLKGPYFPLGRTGKYYAVGMSPRVAELTAKKEDSGLSSSEATELAALRQQADQYKTSSYNTLYEAKKAAEQFKESMGDSYYKEVDIEKTLASTTTKLPNFAKMEEYITSQIGGDTQAQVKSMLNQMMFDMLPEHHALKNQMQREGVYGENEDMRQVFASTSISQAHYISRLKFSNDLNVAMANIGKAARRDNEMQQIKNELALRTKLSMDNTQSALTDSMVNASYFAHLGLSPAFLLTNMTQVPMITAPWLGARHGVGATKRAMAMALADTAKIIKSTYKDGDWRSELNWNSLFPEGSNEDRMFRDLLDRNVLDITMEHDLAAVASAQRGLFDDKISKATGGKIGGMSDVVKLVNTPVRITELANRAVTALSAYRMKMEALSTAPMTAEERHTASVNYAARAVSETQLNYSELNAPRHMRQVFGSKPLAKMIFQFRKYQQGMLYLIAKNISDALPNSKATAEDRRIARRTIAGLYATTGLMAGTTGMPLMGTVGLAGIANLIAAAFGDEDEPWDFEVEYRNFLTDWLGKDMALLVAKGLPAYLGADLSKRVGMGDIANPIPFVQRGQTGQSTVANVLYAAGGAPIGMVGTMYDGIVAIANGDVMKGMEKVIPVKAVKDALRTYRYADEGMTDKRGNVILPPEKFDAWDLTLRGMGFAPTKESEYYAANAAMQEAKTAATDVRTGLLREYSEAKIKGESTEEVDTRIAAFNERHPEKGVKIDMSTKLKSVQARRKMAAERTESGLRVGKYEKPFAGAARFADQE